MFFYVSSSAELQPCWVKVKSLGSLESHGIDTLGGQTTRKDHEFPLSRRDFTFKWYNGQWGPLMTENAIMTTNLEDCPVCNLQWI